MRYKQPIIKLNDRVERTDFKRIFGRIALIKGGKITVIWSDGDKPKKTIESPNKLALVQRVEQ